jgi:hypothetical protein
MQKEQCKFGGNRLGIKGSFFLKRKQSFIHKSPRFLRAMHIRLKSVRKDVHFTLEDEKVFSPYLPSRCSGVIEIRHKALPAHALDAVQVRLKSVSNEGHFTLEAEKVFSPFHTSHSSGVTEIRHMATPAHALQVLPS